MNRLHSSPSHRRILAAAAAMCAAPLARAQQAAWPAERPIRPVVPFAPGGSTDVIARLIADEMRPRLNQTLVVEGD